MLLLTDAQNCFICTKAAFPSLWGPVANLRNARDSACLSYFIVALKIFDILRQRGATLHFELTKVLEIIFGSLPSSAILNKFFETLADQFIFQGSRILRLSTPRFVSG